MSPIRPARVARLFFALVFLSGASVVSAQVARVFVSVNGNDGNTCSNVATPCRTFAGGITQVDDGGEVIVLDTGSYGGTTITKGVTINAPPGVAAFAAQPFTIDATGKNVTLRGLTLKALTPGTGTGVLLTNVGVLTVENSVLNGWQIGIDVAGPGELIVKDSTVKNATSYGIRVNPASGTARATVEHCRLENNSGNVAFWVVTHAKGVLRDSVLIANNVGTGVSSSAATSELNVENCLITGSAQGIFCNDSNSAVRVSNTTVTNCIDGLINFSTGAFESYGNNQIRGNVTNTSGAITTVGRI